MNTDEEDNSRPALLLQNYQAEVDGRGIEPLESRLEIPGSNGIDENLMPREGAHEATEISNSAIDIDNNREEEVINDGIGKDGNMNAGVEFLGLNEVSATETEVVADEGVENSVMATEEVVTIVMDEPLMADVDKVGVEEGLKEEPTDVAEVTGNTDVAENLGEVKEENENEPEVKEKKTLTEVEVGPIEMSEIAEEKEVAKEAFHETGELDAAKTADRVEEEETDFGNAADEMEVTEEEEEMEGDNAEDIGGDNAEKIEEAYKSEDIEGDNAEDIEIADGTSEAAADEVEEVGSYVGKRKRGKNAKAPVRTPLRKKLEEDVCFICFDGGELVLCDRRGCPKAYHPTCVNRDDAFFHARGRWNCGWHICSNCEKNAYYMCYTCTFSLCKGCVKDAVILCVRGNKGFCESCMKSVTLIERNEQDNKAQTNFDDRSSFEHLFKDYWVDLKGKLSLTLDELSQAKNPWKGSKVSVGKRESRDELYDAQNDGGSGSDDSSRNPEVCSSKRRDKKRLKSHSKERESKITKKLNGSHTREAFTDDSKEWASKELLEFIMHMKNGDRSVCSQFDVQELLLEYIQRNKLRDPRRKSQIVCDSRLEKLFGKPRVGHFEMLKLLESNFLLKEDSHADDMQGSVVDKEANQSEIDGLDILMKGKDRRRKSRKKNDRRGIQSNPDDYASIDTNNINLIYLRRSLVENLVDDTETFRDKVVGAFVRIRISGSAQKQDLYRLVPVVGANKAAEPYKVGKKTTEFMLEILNLNKTETVSIDIISNQDFTEDECKRLRQSIKCGLINGLTVGDIQEKAMALQAVRVEDSLESEITRYNHLRDRASDMGHRKDLRECVEKLQLLKSPDERQRRLEEIPEVLADPNMDPRYESEEDDEMDDKKQENSPRSGGSSFNRRGRDPFYPGRGSYSSSSRELSRSLSNKGFSIKGDDFPGGGDMLNENLWSQGEKQPQNLERPKSASNLDNSVHSSESIPSYKQEIAVGPSSKAVVVPSITQICETEKIWHYKDPHGKIQGPFSMVQLRKWSNTGYFPANLRIWRAAENQDDSILLTDALAGNFNRTKPQVVDNQFEITNSTGRATPATDKWDPETNLPSPTPGQAGRSGTLRASRWSPNPVQSLAVGNGEIRHGALVMPQSGHQLSHCPIPSSSSLKMLANSPHMLSQLTLPCESRSPRVQATSNLHLTPDSTGASVNVAVDQKNLQSLVHHVGVTNRLVSALNPEMGGAHAAVHGSSSISGSSQPSAYGGWGQPTGAGPQNQNSGWGPTWRGSVPANSNQGWAGSTHQGPGPVYGQGHAPGNANPGWAGSSQGQTPPNAYPGWEPPSQGPGSVNNQGWVASGQGPRQGNGISSTRNNQQSQSRGDFSRPPPKGGQRVCKFHESGRCKKGASCDYLHT